MTKPFTYTDGHFVCYPASFKVWETRNGIHAQCEIFNHEGQKVCTLNDNPTAIVTVVDFKIERYIEIMRDVAYKKLPADTLLMVKTNDAFAISEYARKFTHDASNAWIDAGAPGI